MRIKTMKYFISGWKEYIRFICLKEKKDKLSPKPPFPSCTVCFELILGKRCFFSTVYFV